MIANRKNNILERAKLAPHWSAYFEYENDNELYNLTRSEFLEVLETKKTIPIPYIDSQQVINGVLTKLGEKHSFHRQFHERHRNSDSGQVLGMQLYHIILEDSATWNYYEIKPNGHLFPHATYWL